MRKSVLAALMLIVPAHSIIAARQAVEPRRTSSYAARAAQELLPTVDEGDNPALSGVERSSLSPAASSSIAPGLVVGYTYYDKQSNGTIGRKVDWGWGSENGLMVHFVWTRLDTEVQTGRHYSYNVYYSQTDDLLGQVSVQQPGEYAGYVNMDVTTDNRAALCGHNNQGGGYQAHLYWDYAPGFGFFGLDRRVDDSVVAAATGQDWQTDSLKSAIWPTFRYQDVPGHEPVTHCFTQVSEPGAGDPQAIIYFRKVGTNDEGDWDYPPYVVDTVFDISQDVACSNVDGKVGLTWFANLPDPGDCDTCSSQTGWPFVQWDNDVYYQISYDYGISWEPRVNLTQNVDGEEGHRPYTDASAIIDANNDLHVAWSARSWPADANTGGQAGLLRGRIFHWGENLGTGGFDGNGDAVITTAGNLEWDQTHCNGGSWNLNGCKLSVSECDGKLYCLWTQFNDIPAGIGDDCHNRALAGTDVVGSANGELYVTVSADGGLTWDWPRDLTNTRTPGCDSVSGSGGRCQSEVWPSMARSGTNHPFGQSPVVIDPSGGYTGDWFLDVQYIDDADPGSIISDEGTWQNNPVRWFRLACVEPVPFSFFEPSWRVIDWPTWTPHGDALDTQLVITNSGNWNTVFTFTIEEDPGSFSGWLTLSPELQGAVTVEAGLDNTVTGTVHLNTGGMVNIPGTAVHLGGRLIAEGNQTTTPDTLPIDIWVLDTLHLPTWDTISTGCLALTVSNHGNFGHTGIGHVNMDFFDYGDCDDLEASEDTIPGNTVIYLYDASPVICRPDGDSVVCNWSIYGDGFPSEHGFVPVNSEPPADSGDYHLYQAEFLTKDSSLNIMHRWYAPHGQPDSCRFLIQVLEISSADGGTHSGLNIGEAIDWDIPADSAVRNRSGFDTDNRLIWQRGSEYDDDDDLECQENSDRYGGIALLESWEFTSTDSLFDLDFWGAYTENNAHWVYPSGGFVPHEIDSMMTENEGYAIESDSLDTDMHTVMTFRHDYTITPDKTLIVYSCLVAGRLGYAEFLESATQCRNWYWDHIKGRICACCIPPISGNIDYDGFDAIDISDLVYLVDYMFTQGPDLSCYDEANVDGSGDGLGCVGPTEVDISDLVYLVDYMFQSGVPPVACP